MKDTMEQFYSDLAVANKTEKEVAEIIKKRFSLENVEFNNDYRFDFKGNDGKKEYSFEVKEDFTCMKTGNIGIEYSCRGRKSGIFRTEADFYIIKAHKKGGFDLVLITVNVLKDMIANKEYFKKVQGGSKESKSFNFLFKKENIFKKGYML